MFTVFFIGQDTVNSAIYEKVKIENTSNKAGSQTSSSSESSTDEDVTFFLLPYSDQIIADQCRNLTLRPFGLPPAVFYLIWLPPDNS